MAITERDLEYFIMQFLSEKDVDGDAYEIAEKVWQDIDQDEDYSYSEIKDILLSDMSSDRYYIQ